MGPCPPQSPWDNALRDAKAHLKIVGMDLNPGGNLLAGHWEGKPFVLFPDDPGSELPVLRWLAWRLLDRLVGLRSTPVMRLPLETELPPGPEGIRLLPARLSGRGVSTQTADPAGFHWAASDGIVECPAGGQPVSAGTPVPFLAW